jgi:hypothetical protein
MRKGKVEQLELTMPEPDTAELRQKTDLTEIVEDVERAAEWLRGAAKRLPELPAEASLARTTDRLRLAKDSIAAAAIPADRGAAIWLLKRGRDASLQASLDAGELGLRCERELGKRLADLKKKLPRDVYKTFLTGPNTFIEQCDKRIKELEQAS